MRPDLDLAVLTFTYHDQKVVYWSDAAPDAPPFLTAPAVLIQGIYEARPEIARKILRERIYTSAPNSEALRGMVKVCAKRIDPGLSVEELRKKIPRNAIRIAPIPQLDEFAKPLAGAPMEQARALARNAANEDKPRYERDRAIGAVLYSREGELLAYAANTNARNRFCHAEVNLLRQLHSRGFKKIPEGASIYVTLKPCKMCAGMIVDFCEDPCLLRIFYDEDDPGPHARSTALDRLK